MAQSQTLKQLKSGKIRTVKGPLGGKTMYVGSLVGQNEIVLTGPKRMTRNQRMGHRFDMMNRGYIGPDPMVEARYRLAMRYHQVGNNVVNVPCQHPDGSYFYEYVEGSVRDRY